MSKIVLPQITNGQDLSTLNSNFSKVAAAFNTGVLWRQNPSTDANSLLNDIDGNAFSIYNLGSLSVTSLTVNGINITDSVASASASALAASTSASLASSQASAASASASNAAASASAASVTLASSLLKANNLSDLANVATAKVNLSLVKADVGLGNVDNTSDVNKPVSTAQATSIALKAPIASPTFTGTVSGITAAMVGLGSVNNTSDSAKPVSTAQAAAIALKTDLSASLSSGAFTDVTSSRAMGATYTNSTGRPIVAVVTVSASTAVATTAQVLIDGVLVGYTPTIDIATYASSITFVVPNGHTYGIGILAGAPTLTRWTEVR